MTRGKQQVWSAHLGRSSDVAHSACTELRMSSRRLEDRIMAGEVRVGGQCGRSPAHELEGGAEALGGARLAQVVDEAVGPWLEEVEPEKAVAAADPRRQVQHEHHLRVAPRRGRLRLLALELAAVARVVDERLARIANY